MPLRAVEPVVWQRPESGIEVKMTEGLARRVTWRPTGTDRPVEVPLVHPVRDIEVGLLPEAGILVLLAGGVRAGESLDLYLADADGRLYVFHTRGGARLPARFNDDLGSWPIAEGEHLILFAYQNGNRIEFRATDLRGQLYAVTTYGPKQPAVTGMRAEADPVTSQVRVFFTGDPEPLVFPHPLAPRVLLSSALLDFGAVTTGSAATAPLELRNSGGRRLVAELELAEGPFQLASPAVVEIAPGGAATVAVRFRPAHAGAQQAHLMVHSNGANPRVMATLRGEGTMATARGEPGQPEPAAPVPAGEVPAADLAPVPPPAPRLLGTSIEPLGNGQVRISGVLLGPAGVQQLRVRASSGRLAQAQVGESGAFQVEITAGPGETLHAVAIGTTGLGSTEREVGRVLPALLQTSGRLEVRGPPGGSFTLLSVVPSWDGEGADLVLDAWQGSLGPDGTGRIDPGSLGQGPLWLIALVKGPSGPGSRTNLVLWRR